MEQVDFLVVGAGVSGASAAAELSPHGKTLLLEAESQPGYHSTGRSAALFTPNFGTQAVRAVNAAAHAFYATPPEGFSEAPLLTPRGALTLARPGEEARLDAVIAEARAEHPIHRIDPERARQLAPLMRPELIGAGAFEPGVTDMDVAAIHQGFLRQLRQRGGALLCSAPVVDMRRSDGLWRVKAGVHDIAARVVVNASGAWGDAVGALAGAKPQGLTPKRRTAIITEAPPGFEIAGSPLVEFVGHGPYLKPDANGVFASLGDETPLQPQDAQPDDMDVALLVDWLETHTHVRVRKAPRAWAGLRTFVSDGAPVVGFDPEVKGFFWLVAQGGYGIMMAPALARLCAGLCVRGEAPADLAAAGVNAAAFAPGRS